MATDVVDLTEEKRSILMNKEVLAVHEDPLFVAGERLYVMDDGTQAWWRPLVDEDIAVVLYNANNVTAIPVSIMYDQLGWTIDTVASVRDLWENSDVGTFTGSYQKTIEPNDVQMIKLTKQNA